MGMAGMIARDMNFNSFIESLVNSDNFTFYMITTRTGLILQSNFFKSLNLSNIYVFN